MPIVAGGCAELLIENCHECVVLHFCRRAQQKRRQTIQRTSAPLHAFIPKERPNNVSRPSVTCTDLEHRVYRC